MARKILMSCVLLAVAMASTIELALAQSYPTKPIRFIVTQGPGGASDIYARLIAQKLSESLGQQVLVDNRPGAEGIIGMEATAKAAPDGYTIVLSASSVLAMNPSLYKKLPYDSVRDFDPISLLGSVFYALVVHPSVPANSLKDFVTLAKAKPNQLNYGSGGTVAHIGTELFNLETGIRLTYVPYKSNPPALTDLLAGQLDMMLLPLGGAVRHVQSGKLKALAVTSPKRFPQLPDTPTMAEAGVPDLAFSAWVAIHAPAGVPKEIQQKLNAEMTKILSMPDVIERFRSMGFEPQSSSPEQLAAFTKSEIAKYAKVIKNAGISQE